MTTRVLRAVRGIVLAALVTAYATGCGQQGPLVLPEDARPIERIDPQAGEPESRDDERQDER
jgi:predicted small lipoprotein YifL